MADAIATTTSSGDADSYTTPHGLQPYGITLYSGRPKGSAPQPLHHLPLSAPQPDLLTPPPHTPVMCLQNPYNPSVAVVPTTTSTITQLHDSPQTSSSTPIAMMSFPCMGNVGGTCTCAGLQPSFSGSSPMVTLNPRFPMCSVPLMNGSVVPYSASQRPFTSAIPMTPPLSPIGSVLPLSTCTAGLSSLFQASILTNSPYLSHGQDNSSSMPSSSMIPAIAASQMDGDPYTSRPPYSFSALIAMAISSSPKKMLTLPEIYNFITGKFPFYKKEDKKWKNSIRHNLSLNKCFTKASREDGLKGKGNLWIIDPACDYILENGSFRSPSKKRKGKQRLRGVQMSNTQTEHSDDDHYRSENETKAILNPSTSTAEVLIPPIETVDRDTSGMIFEERQASVLVGHTHSKSRLSHDLDTSTQDNTGLESLKFGVDKLLS